MYRGGICGVDWSYKLLFCKNHVIFHIFKLMFNSYKTEGGSKKISEVLLDENKRGGAGAVSPLGNRRT